jgi:hypothetical protein
MKTIGYILSFMLFFSVINLACISAKPIPKNLSDSAVISIVQIVLEEVFEHNNIIRDVELNIAKFPEFYDLYGKGIIRDEFYSDDYWLDFGEYHRYVEYNSPSVDYQYIFILPRYNYESFYIATNYYSFSIPGLFTVREPEFEIFECSSKNLVDIRQAMLNEIDPDISDCRSLGRLKIIYTNEYNNPYQFEIIRIE